MDRNTRDISSDSEAMLLFFICSKFLVQDYIYNTSDVPTGQKFAISWKFSVRDYIYNISDVSTVQTFAISWLKLQLLWVLVLYYPYKTMFSTYKSVIVTPCACDLFVSKVMKITSTWMSIFGGHFLSLFSVCDDCILKSATAWLLKLSVQLYIHSFMHVHNTTFQIKTVFNNVLFSTEVHNPLHNLLALSHL